MTKICKKAAQHFHCAFSKVFDMVHKYQKTGQDHKGNGSAATSTFDDKEMLIFVEHFEFGAFVHFANSIPEVIDTYRILGKER
jgi:transposase